VSVSHLTSEFLSIGNAFNALLSYKAPPYLKVLLPIYTFSDLLSLCPSAGINVRRNTWKSSGMGETTSVSSL